MSKIIAYLRVSTDKQDLSHQNQELLEFARKNINHPVFVEMIVSSGKTSKQQDIDDLIDKLSQADTLMVTELSRLGRSTAEVISFGQ